MFSGRSRFGVFFHYILIHDAQAGLHGPGLDVLDGVIPRVIHHAFLLDVRGKGDQRGRLHPYLREFRRVGAAYTGIYPEELRLVPGLPGEGDAFLRMERDSFTKPLISDTRNFILSFLYMLSRLRTHAGGDFKPSPWRFANARAPLSPASSASKLANTSRVCAARPSCLLQFSKISRQLNDHCRRYKIVAGPGVPFLPIKKYIGTMNTKQTKAPQVK